MREVSEILYGEEVEFGNMPISAMLATVFREAGTHLWTEYAALFEKFDNMEDLIDHLLGRDSNRYVGDAIYVASEEGQDWQTNIGLIADDFCTTIHGILQTEDETILREVIKGKRVTNMHLFAMAFKLMVYRSLHPDEDVRFEVVGKIGNMIGNVTEDVEKTLSRYDEYGHIELMREIRDLPTPEGLKTCRHHRSCRAPDFCHPPVDRIPISRIPGITDERVAELEQLGFRLISDIDLKDRPECLTDQDVEEIVKIRKNIRVQHIPGITKKKIGQLSELGIEFFNDIDIDDPPDCLSEKDLDYVEIVQKDIQFVDYDKAKEILKGLKYPIHYLDYETAEIDGVTYVYQYSMHIQKSPDEKKEDMEHHEFIGMGPGFEERLLEDMKSHMKDEGSVVIWSKYERTQNNAMMTRHTHPDQLAFLEDMNRRLFDGEEIYKYKTDIVRDPRLLRTSIKIVAKVMAEYMGVDFSHEDLPIKNGEETSREWQRVYARIIELGLTEEQINNATESDGEAYEIQQSLKNQLEYCKNDTLAMFYAIQRVVDLVRMHEAKSD